MAHILNPLVVYRPQAYGGAHRRSWTLAQPSHLGTEPYAQPVRPVKERIRPVGIARGQPELHAPGAGRETEPVGTPAPEVDRHLVKEFPATAPGHQRQQRGVVPYGALENRRVNSGRYRGAQLGSFG